MAIVKTKLINITANLENMNQVLAKLIELDNVHPVLANQIVERVHGLTRFTTDNSYGNTLNELAKLEKEFNLEILPIDVFVLDYDIEKMNAYISIIKKNFDKGLTAMREVEESLKKHSDALIQVKNIESLSIPLEDIFNSKYITARFGRLPIDSIEKLRFYRSRPFIFVSFHEDQNYSWCMYITSNEFKREVDNIFSSLFFERIWIPDFVHGTPEKARENLENEIQALEEKLVNIRDEMNEAFVKYGGHLAAIKGELIFLNKIFDARKYVVGLGDRFTISLFVENKNVKYVQKQFEGIPDLEFEVRPPGSDKRISPPTKLRNGWFSRPFSLFVEMYGVPKYNDLDPTPILAITYSLLFGIMFGDVGQGLVLALLGFILARWKKMRLGEVGVRIGISSTIFGFLYGSVFGNEEILTPFYTNVLGFKGKPINVMSPNFTMNLLIFSVAIGALLIILSIVLNIFLNLKKRNIPEMLFSANGISGLLFYLFLFGGFALNLILNIKVFNIYTILIFIVLPLLLIFFKEPLSRKLHDDKAFPSGFGGFLTEGIFELFEVFLAYVTNTMSFLRVGGFILSHAGMMLVVYTLMDMTGNASLFVAIIGNILVMGLEGLIVGIQVLRLEFYEMFSRYYEGNGIAFETINNY